MNFQTQINCVKTLNNFIELSQDIDTKFKDEKLPLNLSTFLSLKKIRSLEIEYFSKCDDAGAAFKLFARILNYPPSKLWALLGTEPIGLIQYWLDAVRKHLISHHMHWWSFLKQILRFVKKLQEKNDCLSSMMVEESAESLLELATNDKLDILQQFEILHTFNLICARSSRNIRWTLRDQLEPYFIRLSELMSTCGHLPTQLASLETLFRWLQPRHDADTRRAAAAKWLRPPLYSDAAVDVFLTRSWFDFFQDARDFLNCHNEAGDLITSVVCRKLSVGNKVILTGRERHLSWVDVNAGSRALSVVLEPARLAALGAPALPAREALHIPADIITRITLCNNEAGEVCLSVEAVRPATLSPLGLAVDAAPRAALVLARAALPRLDRALRAAFQHKYLVLLDVNKAPSIPPSPERAGGTPRNISSDESSRFSNPPKENITPRSGHVTWSKKLSALNSLSSVSTASLAQLHNKLDQLPYYEFPKKHDRVLTAPSLSAVSERSELNSAESPTDHCWSPFKESRPNIEARKSQSDCETFKSKGRTGVSVKKQNNSDPIEKIKEPQIDKSSSALFLTTILSAPSSIISNTVDRLKDKEINTDNLVELLVQEASESKSNDDSGIITDGKKSQELNDLESETIEDTQYTGSINIKAKTLAGIANVSKTHNKKVVSKSTSDESNTEAIIDTPMSFVTVRKRNKKGKFSKNNDGNKSRKNVIVDGNAIEDYFSSHFAKTGYGIISPTHAKKINETSTESSNDFLIINTDNEFDILNDKMPDLDVTECLNDIVDKVCSDFEKCSEYLIKNNGGSVISNMAMNLNTPLKRTLPSEEKDTSTDDSLNAPRKKIKSIKLRFPWHKTVPKTIAKGKLELEPVSKMSIIPECANESDGNKTSNSDLKKTPLGRRKRKLYSPKDDQIQFDKSKNDYSSSKPDVLPSESEDDITLAEFNKNKLATPKSSVTCYREIEKERKKYIRTRPRKSKTIESPPSPKTKRLDDVFEKLKENIEVHSNDQIILADKNSEKDFAIYNFTSDSEDEDFKKKKIELQKRKSSNTIGSATSTISTRRRRNTNKVMYTEDNKESENETSKPAKRKKYVRRKPYKTKFAESAETKVDHPTNLIDEIMREAAPETLDTSFIANNIDNKDKEQEPVIQPHELEVTSDGDANIDIEDAKSKKNGNIKIASKNSKVVKSEKRTKKQDDKKPDVKKNIKRDKKEATKQKKKEQKTDDQKDDERTISPLPCLVVETEVTRNKLDDSIPTNFIQNFQKAYREGPDAHNDTITTQNMLSDNEKTNKSPRMNINDELGNIFAHNVDMENSDVNIIDNTINSDQVSRSSVTESKKRKKLSLKRDKSDTEQLSFISNTFKQVAKTPRENSEQHKVLSYSEKPEAKRHKSHEKEINYDEIICIDANDVTSFTGSNVIQNRSRSKDSEIIDLTGDDDLTGDSIATNGITGHGDISEPPPSPKLLSMRMLPREIEDMEATVREHYIELSNKLINSKDSSKDQINDKDIDNRERTVHKVMKEDDSASNSQSIEQEFNKLRRQLFQNEDYEIERLLPSDREEFQNEDYEIERLLPSDREESLNHSQECRKSLNVSITRLSSKDLSRWLPGTKTTPKSSCKTTQKPKEESLNSSQGCQKSLNVSITRLSSKDFSRWLPATKTTLEFSGQTTPKSKKNSKRSARNITSKSCRKITKKSTETPDNSLRLTRFRKSQISPIACDLIFNHLRNNNSGPNDETVNTQDVEMVSKFDSICKKYFTLSTEESHPTLRAKESHPTSRAEESHPTSRAEESHPTSRAEESHPNSRAEESHPTSRVEESHPSAPKAANISESRQSSNVEDWLRKENTTTDHSAEAFGDILQNIMEKLNTTLPEIHENTTREMLTMYADVQRRLEAMTAQNRQEYQEMLAAVEKRNEERANSFMSWLRERIANLLQLDCRQKKMFLNLLKDDVKEAFHRVQNQHREN